MRTFVYHNYMNNTDITIKAEDILQADKKYEKLTRIKPVKANYISCRINSKIGHMSKEDYETMTIMFDQLGFNDGSDE